MSVRGVWVRMRDGRRAAARALAIALDSEAETPEIGRMWVSSVALEGCSAAKRTSMGPDTVAIVWGNEPDGIEIKYRHIRRHVPNPNLAEPSTLASESEVKDRILRSALDLPSGRDMTCKFL